MAKSDYRIEKAADGNGQVYVLDKAMVNETGSPLIYPFGFEPTFHRYRMGLPEKLKIGKNIFVGAMSDIFGACIPDDWIKEVLAVCCKYPIHNYLFLTKNPERYEDIDSARILPAGKNMWYGSTLTRPEDKCILEH